MPLTDLSLADCRAYRPELPDFDAFWARTLSEVPAAGESPLAPPLPCCSRSR